MKKILIAYHSQQSGNTKKMAELVAKGCRTVAGVELSLVNTNETRVDMNELLSCDGLALGSPDYFTYMAGGLKQFFDDAMTAKYEGAKIRPLPYVAFVTHGGGGGAIDSIEKLAERFGFKKAADSVLSKGAPEGDAANKAVLLGQSLAEKVVEE